MTPAPKKEPVALLIESLFPDGSLVLQTNGLFLESIPGGTPVYVHRGVAQFKVIEAMKKKGILKDADKKVAEKWGRILPTHEFYHMIADCHRSGLLLYIYSEVLFPNHETQETETNP
jgi:hypothetical protein